MPALTDTDKVLAELSPQLLLAITLIFPLFPDAPVITSMLGELEVTVVALLFHPFGKVHVYSVALATAAIE